MKIIICKKCGAELDPAKGQCPVCGTIYYVLREDDLETDLSSPFVEDESEATRIWQAGAVTGAVRSRSGGSVRSNAGGPSTVRTEPRPAQPLPASGETRQQQPRTQRTQYEPQPRNRGGDRRFLVVGAVALLAVLTLLICLMSGVFDFGPKKDAVYMPKVVGLGEATARSLLEPLGVEVLVEQEDSSYAAGIVLHQSLKEGAKLGNNETVTLTVSSGKQEEPENETDVQVPRLVGMSYDLARLELEGRGLMIIRLAEEYNEAPAGQVIAQNPNEGAWLVQQDVVTVTVSLGPEPEPTVLAHTITVTAGKGGSVSPKGQISVADGSSLTFEIFPDEGYELRELLIDGTDVGPQLNYTFTNVAASHTLYAVFQVKTEPSPGMAPAETPAETPITEETPEQEPVPTPEAEVQPEQP